MDGLESNLLGIERSRVLNYREQRYLLIAAFGIPQRVNTYYLDPEGG